MSNYKHGNWYCKPTNEEEAREIIERAVASGAELYETVDKCDCHFCYAWGVYLGETFTGGIDVGDMFGGVKEYTIAQLRELFPLPSEQAAGWDGEGLPPVGAVCELIENCGDVEIIAHAKNIAGEVAVFKRYNTQGNLSVSFRAANSFRLLRPERERWIEQAERAIEARTTSAANSAHIGLIYDAIKSGDLKAPEVE